MYPSKEIQTGKSDSCCKIIQLKCPEEEILKRQGTRGDVYTVSVQITPSLPYAETLKGNHWKNHNDRGRTILIHAFTMFLIFVSWHEKEYKKRQKSVSGMLFSVLKRPLCTMYITLGCVPHCRTPLSSSALIGSPQEAETLQIGKQKRVRILLYCLL